MKSLCVFAGSSSGVTTTYTEAARALGRSIAARSLRLVYGGAKFGLMGEIAESWQHVTVPKWS